MSSAEDPNTPSTSLRRPGLRLRAFLPLSEDSTSFSTRGQNLPSILSSHLGTPPLSSSSAGRRPSSLRYFGGGGNEAGYDVEAQRVGVGELERRSGSSDGESVSTVRNVGGGGTGGTGGGGMEDGSGATLERRISSAAQILMTPEMRSQRLIGNSNPRYKWERYFKTEAELKTMKKPIREYYERNNSLIQQYLYIDKLLDSSLPHDLIAEYHHAGNNRNSTPNLHTINEEVASPAIQIGATSGGNGYLENANGGSSTPNTNASTGDSAPTGAPVSKLKRTPKNLYKLPDEQTPLIRVPSKGDAEISEGNTSQEDEEEESEQIILPDYDQEESTSSSSPVVLTAIYLNLTANTLLLILKIIVSLLTSSVSVLASTVDAALDFLSTAIIWTTTRLISMQDRDRYPVGRRRLEPIGVLVFSVIMITSFVQVALEGFNRLNSPSPHTVVQLTYAAIAIMASTVVIKAGCWFWCRLVNNSSVQALAQDAKTDVVFNVFSIVFPIVGYYAKVWWLDSLGGILLSGYVIYSWSATSSTHIRQLTGAAATADERNVLLYLTMRFAHTIKQIQGLQAYHAGDKLNVEVDVVLDEATSLRDSHDLGESLQYVLESVPYVDRAFVHLDYAGWNLPSHMEQQE